MTKEELIKLQGKLKASMLETWKLWLQIDKALNSSPEHETSKVGNNEKAREGCREKPIPTEVNGEVIHFCNKCFKELST